LSGSSSTTCQPNGAWSSSAPTCVANPCPTLSAPANGGVSSTSGSTGDTRTYACNTGYTLSGSSSTTCQPNGAWSNSAPTCVANACPTLSAPANGGVDNPSGSTGDTRTYSCNTGYTIVGSATTTCQTDGTWSSITPG